MQKKKGVSLIVLSITILVMAILAATAIIALEDSGIIKRGKDTVKNNNYSDEYTRLIVIKNGVLTDNLGTITVDEYVAELTNKGLIESTIVSNADGSKTVTTKTGFTVNVSQNGASDLNIVINGYTQPNNNSGNSGDSGSTATPTITLNKTTISKTIDSGTTATETLTATTQNISGTLTWTSSNTSVATVTASGNTATVTMKAGGTAIITATYGSTSASCTVTVTENTPVTYALSGTWVINSSVTLPSSTISEIGLTYTSNGSSFKGMIVGTSSISYTYATTAKNTTVPGFTLAAYDGSGGSTTTPTEVVAYNGYWSNTSYRTVNFGATSQTVSQVFYNWFTSNAVKSTTTSSVTINDVSVTPYGDVYQGTDSPDTSETLTLTANVSKTNTSQKLTYTFKFNSINYSTLTHTYISGEDVSTTSTSSTITLTKSANSFPSYRIWIELYVTDESGNQVAYKSIDNYIYQNEIVYTTHIACIPAGTLILVEEEYEDENGKKKKRRKKKKIEDLTYDDDLVVWDFDNGCFTTAKPIWLMKKQYADEYNELTFSNGAVLKTIREHRIFNKELGKFTYPMGEETNIGTTTFTEDGEEVTLTNRRVVDEKVEYYNVITNYHINAFAEGILTSCRLSNLYEIKDMKYVKDDREIVGIEEFKDIPEEYYYGLRLGEQRRNVNNEGDFSDLNSWTEYVNRLISRKK